ncbi:MAG: TIR domain-containing protein [Pseudonocardiaceae bacterium]
MPDDIFINYRNGDEEATATVIEREMSRRFGSGQVVFRASKSIRLGEDYIPSLLDAVRGSQVLLAIIGSRWLTAVDGQGRNRLYDEADWTRKEILEAFEHGVRVIPVLVGRTHPRLNSADLPPERARLAELQSYVVDHHSAAANLRTLGDDLAELVPSLVDRDQPEEAAEPDTDDGRGSTTLRAGDHARQQSGSTNTVINDAHAPVHGGSGNQLTGDGVNYVEGDNRGGIRQKFGSTRKQPDDKP